MSEALVELIKLVIAGFGGYASFAYLLWKKFRKDIRVYYMSGTYELEKSKNEVFCDIKSTVEVGFLNKSDETVSITDVVGFLKYNKELYDKRISSQINVPKIPDVYERRPENFHEVVNFSIEPHQVAKKTIEIVFPNMVVDLVDRIRLAYFTGFLGGKTALFTAHESELKEKWSAHPLDLLLVFHIDGKKIHHMRASLFKKGEIAKSGTLGVVEIEKVKMDYRDGRP